MQKLFASLRKEILILSRDIPGLVILFLLPVVLIMVVTTAQNFALTSHLSKTKVLIVDLAKSHASSTILQNIREARMFEPVVEVDGLPVGLDRAKTLISKGDYSFGIVMYPADSAIHILLDPALNESFKVNLSSAFRYIIQGAQGSMAIDGMLTGLPPAVKPLIDNMIRESLGNLPPIREVYAQKDLASIKPNVIQNNVPGFILFAMFFVVIPLSGSLINEKKDVAFQRIRTLPVTMMTLLGSKVIVYTLVCLLQFLLMIAVGLWVFPVLFDLPQLRFGGQYFAIAVATLAASIAAVGFGILVGAAATSHNQAALFGSVMVVLLGVISGTFLPVHVMPEFFQTISHFSPLSWGIENYLDLFIREGSMLTILPNCLFLLLFFGLAMMISLLIFAKRN